MSTTDDINDDAEFSAFLKREGKVAQQLQSLPQPQPSAQLDAAILAAAKAQLEASRTPQIGARVAANDEVPHSGKRAAAGFFTRWRIPIGIAASLLVTVQLVRMEFKDESYEATAPAQRSEMPQKPAAPAPTASVPPQPAEQHESVIGPQERKEKFSALRSQPAPEAQKAGESKGRPEFKARRETPAAPPHSTDNQSQLQAPPPAVANSAPAQYLGRAATKSEATAVESARAPLAAPAPASAPAAVAALSGGLSTGFRTAPTTNDKASSAPSSANVETAAGRPEAWLAAIDRLLTVGLPKDALAEWVQFRKAYPDYPAPEKLNDKIKALQDVKQ